MTTTGHLGEAAFWRVLVERNSSQEILAWALNYRADKHQTMEVAGLPSLSLLQALVIPVGEVMVIQLPRVAVLD